MTSTSTATSSSPRTSTNDCPEENYSTNMNGGESAFSSPEAGSTTSCTNLNPIFCFSGGPRGLILKPAILPLALSLLLITMCTDPDNSSIHCQIVNLNKIIVFSEIYLSISINIRVNIFVEMNFNIDFLANQMIKKKPHSGRINVEDLRQFVKVMSGVERAVGRLLTLKAFQKISVSRRPRVCRLECVQRVAKNKLKSAFFDLKRGSVLSKKYVMKKEQLLNYPLAVVKRWISGKMTSNQAEAFAKLKNNMLFINKCKRHLDSMAKVQREYIRKSYFVNIMNELKSKTTKEVEYKSHLCSFEYLFDCMRIRVLFETFTHLAIKSTQKNIGELEGNKTRKRDTTRSVNIKRNEVHNDLKRKINNLLGQINENQINNNRRKVNGVRENGFKLLKINEQTRITMDSISYLEFQVQKLEKEVERKSKTVHARSSQTISLDQFKQIYDNVLQTEQNKIVKKVAPGNRIQKFKESLNFLVLENAKLKHEVNIYEKMSSTKKESYYIAEHENTYIKQIFQSIIRHHLMTDIATELVQLADSTRDHARQYRTQWRKVKSTNPRK